MILVELMPPLPNEALFYCGVSCPASLVGAAIGALVGLWLCKVKWACAYTAIAGAVGCAIGACLGFNLWWTYYAQPIVHQIVYDEHRAPGSDEPPGMLASFIVGGFVGATVFSVIVALLKRK
jgi:hypothetical protein